MFKFIKNYRERKIRMWCIKAVMPHIRTNGIKETIDFISAFHQFVIKKNEKL
jgi:hypothetical protein